MEEVENKAQRKYTEVYKLGFLLIGAGVLILIDQKLNTGWLTLSIPAIAGALIAVYGIVRKETGWTIGGNILLGAGAGLIVGLIMLTGRSPLERVGGSLLAFDMGWLILFFFVSKMKRKVQWWSLVVMSVITSTGFFLFFTSSKNVFSYLVYLSAFLGVVFLSWGISKKSQGLIIAGCIILSIAPAFYYSWVNNINHSSLVKTGTMLVWLALGWLMICFFGRMIFRKFIWWPIIPGGVFAMVGWGLYLGGAAGRGLGFISNTGSVALILFGIYLILLKYGLRN